MAQIEASFKKEVAGSLQTDKQGIIAKADSLGSLEALLTLLRQSHIQVVRTGIGPITKSDVVAAKANLEIDPLDAIIVGFNVSAEEDIEFGSVKVFTDEVVYKLIQDLEAWRTKRRAEIEKEKLMGLATVCKLEILPQYVFRNSNPAIFGARVLAGTARTGLPLIDENDNDVAHLKGIQSEKHAVQEAQKDAEVAISLPGVTFDRQLKETRFLYANLSETQFKAFKKHKELLSSDELRVLQELQLIKQRKNPAWGIA
jgi:translation initiation factor 5B